MKKKPQQLIEKIHELEARLNTLEKRKRQKRIAWLGVLFVIPVGLWAATVIPNGFTDGDTLSAAKLNENFQALAAKIDAMEGKSWRLIYESDVTSATSAFMINGLDGDTDGTYMIIFRGVSSAAGSHFAIRPNADAVGANYSMLGVFASGATPNGDTSAAYGPGLYLGVANSVGDLVAAQALIYAKRGYRRVLNSSFAYNVNTTNGTGSYSTVWQNTGSNITSMQVVSDATNGIGAGSHIEIWAKR